MRRQMLEIVRCSDLRHGHMVAINQKIMMQAMQADFEQVDLLTKEVLFRASAAKKITCASEGGTYLEATFSSDLNWVPTSGIIRSNIWSNLPGGQVFTTPASINGLLVGDGALGDWLGTRFPKPADYPLYIEIEDSRVKNRARSINSELEQAFDEYVKTDENSSRVGEFGIGTNVWIEGLIGHMLQDEKLPGMHLAFGNPYPSQTGADWTSATHLDVLPKDATVYFDDLLVIQEGQYTEQFMDEIGWQGPRREAPRQMRNAA